MVEILEAEMKQAIVLILLSIASGDYTSLREFCDGYDGDLTKWGEFAAGYMIGVPFVYTRHRTKKTKVTELWDLILQEYKKVTSAEKTKVFTKYTEHDFRYRPAREPSDPNTVDISPPPINLTEIILNDPNRYGPLSDWKGLLE